MADSQEPRDGALELREIAGDNKLCPHRHGGTTWRVLFEWDEKDRRWYILTQWYKCPVCSRKVIAEPLWPLSALAAYETRVESEKTGDEPPRILIAGLSEEDYRLLTEFPNFRA